jgi:hypothetical protein
MRISACIFKPVKEYVELYDFFSPLFVTVPYSLKTHADDNKYTIFLDWLEDAC